MSKRSFTDAERLNFIGRRGFDILSFTHGRFRVQDADDGRMHLYPEQQGVRSAIDAAMREEGLTPAAPRRAHEE